MKLRTSQILAQLSEQDRNKAEAELAEIQGRKIRLLELREQSLQRIQSLHVQRNETIARPHAASLLQAFELSLREQQTMLAAIAQHLEEVEADKQRVLGLFAEAYRTQHTYEEMHQQRKRQLRRREEQQQQRQMDDMIAARKVVGRS